MCTVLPALGLTKAAGRSSSIDTGTVTAVAQDSGATAVVAALVAAVVLGLVFRNFLRDVGESLVGLVVALFTPLPPLGRVFVGSLLAGLTVGALLVGFDVVAADPRALGAGQVADQAIRGVPDGHTTSIHLPGAVQLLLLGFVFVAGFAVGGEVEKRTLNAQWRRLASRRKDHNEAVRRGRLDLGVIDTEAAPSRPAPSQPAELEARHE